MANVLRAAAEQCDLLVQKEAQALYFKADRIHWRFSI